MLRLCPQHSNEWVKKNIETVVKGRVLTTRLPSVIVTTPERMRDTYFEVRTDTVLSETQLSLSREVLQFTLVWQIHCILGRIVFACSKDDPCIKQVMRV